MSIPTDHDRATAFALEWLPELNDAFASSMKFRARLVEEFAHVRTEEREACARIAERCEPGAPSAGWSAARRCIAGDIRHAALLSVSQENKGNSQ